jgi:VCBS repeat-containing protein
VNGAAVNVGTESRSRPGAKVTLNANGSYTYKPNGAFEFLDTTESTSDAFTYQAFDGDV